VAQDLHETFSSPCGDPSRPTSPEPGCDPRRSRFRRR